MPFVFLEALEMTEREMGKEEEDRLEGKKMFATFYLVKKIIMIIKKSIGLM